MLDRIAAAIAPWSLPPDLACLWRRVALGPEEFAVTARRMPAVCDPRAALEAHRLTLEPGLTFLYGPPLLFPFAVDKETHWSVELASEWAPGGAVLSHDDAIRVEYPSVADVLDVFAEVIEAGAFETLPEGRLVLRDEAERAARERRLRRGTLHPTLAGTAEISNDPSGWPEHWLRAAGLDTADRAPLGATHTIPELRRAAAEEPREGRIAGTVVRLAFLGDGYLVRVDDGSDTLDVWCPVETTTWGLVHGGRFELAVRIGSPASVSVDEVGESAPAAAATAVRPLDR